MPQRLPRSDFNKEEKLQVCDEEATCWGGNRFSYVNNEAWRWQLCVSRQLDNPVICIEDFGTRTTMATDSIQQLWWLWHPLDILGLSVNGEQHFNYATMKEEVAL